MDGTRNYPYLSRILTVPNPYFNRTKPVLGEKNETPGFNNP